MLQALSYYAWRRRGAEPVPSSMPVRLGRYPLLQRIGQGSMGTVYKSIDPSGTVPLAVKVIRCDRNGQEARDFLLRLRIEAEAGGRLEHPGIVAVYGLEESGPPAILVTEYVQGKSLREYLKIAQQFSAARAIDIVLQLLAAVQYAHDRGVWHRDIKPANVLLTHRGEVKLADFGIAAVQSCAMPQPEAILGTPGFIAPEAYLSDDIDGRVDVYACGAILYQLLTGVPPFTGSAQRIMFKACHETPALPSAIACEAYLRPVDAVVLKALARHPEDRYATPGDFLRALQPHAGLRRRR